MVNRNDGRRFVKLDVIASLEAASTMLYEILYATESTDELRTNDNAVAVTDQMKTLIPMILSNLESEAGENIEVIIILSNLQ